MATLLETANFQYQNFYSDALSADLSSTATDVFLSNPPSISEGTLIIDPFTPSKREIIYFNALGTGKVTCPATGRGYDNTAATTHTSGTTVISAPIADWFYSLRSLFTTSPQGWTNLNTTLTYNANNGTKEFVYNTSNDLTGILSPGMRFAGVRSVAAPTQCASLAAASSQYATKATPTGITNTGDFTVEAMVYLNSYAGGSGASIVLSRFTGASTSGWGFQLHADGTPQVYYSNASGITSLGTYRAIPLKTWVHIAASVSVASKSAIITINGEQITTQLYASSATSVVQDTGADLRVGTGSGSAAAGNYFDGQVAEVRYWTVAQTLTQIRNNMGLSLTGAETNLAALYQFNGNANDKTSNANNLTLTNGASATNTTNAAYYHNTEVGIITNVTSSQITIFGGMDYILPNMTFTSQQYSAQKSPFGFNANRKRWGVFAGFTNSYASSSTSWAQAPGRSFNVPVGQWDLQGTLNLVANSGGASGNYNVTAAISTSTTAPDDNLLSYYTQWYTTGLQGGTEYRSNGKIITADTTYYVIGKSTGVQLILGTDGNDLVFVESAYA